MNFFSNIQRSITRKFTGFEAITWAAVLIISCNALYELSSPFKDLLSFYFMLGSVSFLLIAILLYREHFRNIATFLSLSAGNALIFWTCWRLGTNAGGMLYYFPFIISFLFVFRTENNSYKILGYFMLFLVTVVLITIFCYPVSPYYHLPTAHLHQIYYTCLVSSIVLTFAFLWMIYDYQNRLNRKIILKQELKRKRILRFILETQESERQTLVEELRNNINQILVSGMKMLEVAGESDQSGRYITLGYNYTKSAVEELNSLCTALSPALIRDIGLKDGLTEYINNLNRLKGMQITSKLTGEGIERIPVSDKLSIYRIIQHCIELLMTQGAAKIINIEIEQAGKKIKIRFSHNAGAFDIVKAIHTKYPYDLQNRIDYYNGQLYQQLGMVTVTIPIHF